MLKPLTIRQRQIVEFIHSTKFPPTVREICNRFGFASPNAALCHLRALERKGAIVREPGTRRGIVRACTASLPYGGQIGDSPPTC